MIDAEVSRVRHYLLVGMCFLVVIGTAVETVADPTARKQCRRLLREVRTHMQADQPDSAAVLASRAMACDPSQADCYWYLAHAQLSLGEPEQARSTLDRGVKAAPLSQRLMLFRARLYLEVGDLDTAREGVQKALILPMRRGEALYLRGRIELAEGDSLAAIESWRQALESNFRAKARR